MPDVVATPADAQNTIAGAAPGDRITLRAGVYGKLRLRSLRGTPAQPIIVRGEPGAVLEGGLRFEDFNPRAMDFILPRWDADQDKPAEERNYPGLHSWLDPAQKLPGVSDEERQAQLTIEGCAHVRVEMLSIRGSWPAAIAIADSPHVTLSGLMIEEGTYAIHARGAATRSLLVDGCSWIQDVSRTRLWRDTAWVRMHDDEVNPADARAFDGDFLQGIDLGPGLVVRHCRVEHAFNGVHLWNSGGRADLACDVRIHDNWFSHIRDNIVEPEVMAWRWWVYRNRIENCHKWFSFEVKKGGGFFYIFGNLGWYDSIPGSADDANRGGGVLKLLKDIKPGVDHGPWYMFHNSWRLRSTYARTGRIAHLVHANNAISYSPPAGVDLDPALLHRPFFGLLGYSHARADYQERERFTTAWRELDIEFGGDLIRHHEVPHALHAAGYPSDLCRVQGDEPFVAPRVGEAGLLPAAACKGSAVALAVTLPDGRRLTRAAGADVGAFQGAGLLAWPELEAAAESAAEA